MKILKLLFAVAIFTFIVVNSSFLQAADEPASTTTNTSTSNNNSSSTTSVSQSDNNIDIFADEEFNDEKPQGKSFIRKLMFWKKDDPDQLNQENDIDTEITDEDIDPRLKKEREKPTEIRIRNKYGIKVDTLKLFETNLKVQDENGINKDTEFVVPLDDLEREMYIEEYYDRKAPIVMSHLDLRQSIDSYKNTYFSNFKQIARIKVIYKDIPDSEVKGYGAYIGANLIIMKKMFEPTIGKYVYDIIFLSGNVEDKNIYWYRNSSEAEPLDITLKALNVKNLDDYMNIISHNMLNPNRKVYQKINENYEAEKQKESEEAAKSTEEQNNVSQRQRLESLVLRAQEAKNSPPSPDDASNFSMYLLNNLTEEELYELQKELITFRVNAVVGLWEDVITGEVIEIRALPKTKTQSDITYAAYVLLGEDLDSIVRYTNNGLRDSAEADNSETLPENNVNTVVDNITSNQTLTSSGEDDFYIPEPTNVATPGINEDVSNEDILASEISNMSINKSLAWLSQDLKMQFSSVSGSGFFLDDEKMVENAIVYFHPAKGLIVVALPNKEFKYYKPIIPDMYPALDEALYNKMNIKETNVDQNKVSRFSEELESAPGTTNYFLYPGVTLGVIAAFLLIFM